MSNEVFETLAIAAVVAMALAGILALKYRNLSAIVLTNLIGAGIIIVINAQNLGIVMSTSDWGILLIVAFALLTIATTLFWFTRPKMLHWLVWVEFSIFSLLSVGLLIFAFTFKITRLF